MTQHAAVSVVGTLGLTNASAALPVICYEETALALAAPPNASETKN